MKKQKFFSIFLSAVLCLAVALTSACDPLSCNNKNGDLDPDATPDLEKIIAKYPDSAYCEVYGTASNTDIDFDIKAKVYSETNHARIDTNMMKFPVSIYMDYDTGDDYIYVSLLKKALKVSIDLSDYAPHVLIKDLDLSKCTILGEQVVDGKKCAVFVYEDALPLSSDYNSRSTTIWLWEDYGFPVRMETSDVYITFSKMSFKDIDDEKFVLPGKASVIDASGLFDLSGLLGGIDLDNIGNGEGNSDDPDDTGSINLSDILSGLTGNGEGGSIIDILGGLTGNGDSSEGLGSLFDLLGSLSGSGDGNSSGSGDGSIDLGNLLEGLNDYEGGSVNEDDLGNLLDALNGSEGGSGDGDLGDLFDLLEGLGGSGSGSSGLGGLGSLINIFN
ncbi:MAG: hypothetical protein IKR78_06170 [Dehalococcoidales bacterium]|nr:hypothetical protein [Dehalococcoidales bacterium]